MKSTIGSLALIALLTATFTGCGDNAKPSDEVTFKCEQDGVLAPKWTCNPGVGLEGAITEVGSAPYSKLGAGFTRREALANARSNLAQQIESLVKDKVETFARSTGIGGREVADKVSTQVSKQAAKVSLRGSQQVNFWQHPQNKAMYILVGMDENSMNKEIKNNVQSSYKNDEALWQQFQAKNALESLEKEFPSN
ncbi:LPP20 family lipoprotein [Sulfurimonas sp. MAG313]|nr:LPP20 family lipoprotein [Sulfurimonas sp. MAG313]MDF1882205.1 LPP20 family lipoprotein [Sulfurimonas sp. MAG313]